MKLIKSLGIGLGICFASFNANAQFTSTVVSLTGTVLDQGSKKPTSIQIEVFDKDGDKFTKAKSNSKDGYYFITGFKPGETYSVRVLDIKYLKNSFDFTVPNTDKYSEYSRDILVVPSRIDTDIPLSVIPFEINKSNLRPGADNFLNEYAQILLENPKVKINLEVFPDNNLDKSKNRIITNGRAEALKNYFEKAGIEASRIAIKNFDTTDPKNPPPSEKRAKGKRYVGSVYLNISAL